MKNIPLVKVANFSPFPRFLSEGGCDVERVLNSMGIGLETMASEESFVPRILACRFLKIVARNEGIDRVGLEVGQRVSARDLGAFGVCLGRSLTVHDLLRRLLLLMPMTDTGHQVWMEPDPLGNVKFCYRPDDPLGRAETSAYALLSLIDAVRMAAGPSWRPKKVWLEKAAGSGLERYEMLSEAAADRDVDYAAFEIPRELLSLSLAASSRKGEGRDIFDDALLAAPPEDVAGVVSQVIRASFGVVTPTIRLVSEMASTSVRTLQRRLRVEGTSYGDLVDRIRFEEAVSLVRHSDRPIAEIARHLGYAEAAPFSIAFRRWTGEAPLRYRKMSKG